MEYPLREVLFDRQSGMSTYLHQSEINQRKETPTKIASMRIYALDPICSVVLLMTAIFGVGATVATT